MGDSISIIHPVDPASISEPGITVVPSLPCISGVESIRDRLLLIPRSANLFTSPLIRRVKEAPSKSKDKTAPSSSKIVVELIPSMTLDRLKAQGFVYLANKISEKEGPPWNSILQVNEPLIIEQLYDLIILLELKGVHDSSIYQHAFSQALKNTPITTEWIGKLIYLTNQNPSLAAEQAMLSQDAFISWVEDYYLDQIDSLHSFLKEYKESHENAALQNSEIAYYNQLTVELTNFLLTETGNINVGLITPLLEFIQSGDQPLLNHASSIVSVLKSLEKLPDLREQVAQIRKPSSSKSPVNVVIRTTLDIPPTVKITDLESKKTALAALLSHLRQGPDGSCFATSLAIGLLNNHLSKCLSDFSQLLQSSKLTREVNNISCDFPFILKIGDQNLSEIIKFNHEGCLVLSTGVTIPLKEVPGIQAVLTALGLDKPKIVHSLFREIPPNETVKEIELKYVLQALVKQAKELPENSEKGLAMLYLDACFAYEAQQCNPLLQVWENSIAGMAEADEESMVRSAILSSTMRVFKERIKQLPNLSKTSRKILMQCLKKELLETIHLQYDPQITYSDRAVDQRSTEGAFVLYDKGHFSKPTCWIRIDTPDLYQTFIHRLVESSKRSVKKEVDREEWKVILEGFGELEKYFSSPKFIIDSISDYYPPNGKILNPVLNYHCLSFAPWVTKSGNNLNKVLQVYFEDPKLQPSTQVSPKNAAELIYELIEKTRSLKKTTLANYQARPNHTIPVRIPNVHAFSLLPAHPTFISSWQDEPADTTVWINTKIVLPGIKIASSKIPDSTRSKLVLLTQNNLIHSSNHTFFLAKVEELSNELSIEKYREALLDIILKLQPEYAPSHKQFALQLDTYIYQSLPEKLQAELHQQAVHFADSNWRHQENRKKGVHNIHFAAVINPGNGEIELWNSLDDGSKLFPLEQSTWFEKKSWEIYAQVYTNPRK